MALTWMLEHDSRSGEPKSQWGGPEANSGEAEARLQCGLRALQVFPVSL